MKGGKSSGAVKKTDKLAVKKPVAKAKAGKDSNKPKRPASAFFVFMEEFREQYKEENPNNKYVVAVSKAGGAKWKYMSVNVSPAYFIPDLGTPVRNHVIFPATECNTHNRRPGNQTFVEVRSKSFGAVSYLEPGKMA